ncbi:LOW QUALITY PROTEIN: RING finger protein 148 [Orycteropus afer afer]|uniref:LOW QUALITY PROTEIN: RING finger protein 148 n=1 Tax=Orycteropus afer afer TaxID=1230840 RepID=A0A8B7ATQ4_ORYAF|nr:LOW QUALITY PROTEIN: RING finger protein 148 [Orycteropus afer afer]
MLFCFSCVSVNTQMEMSLLTTTPTHSSVSSRLLRLSLFLLLSLPDSTGKAIWTAHLNITFQVGNRIISKLGESGVFGNHSPLERVSGAVALPDTWNQNACNPMTNFSRPEQAETWLALIERGGCTFTHKINVAAEKGANGVIIYNYPGTGNKVFPMSHQGTDNIVAVMIGNLKGLELLHLIQKGVSVTIIIEVGRMHMPWLSHCVMSLITFLAASIAYLFLYCAWRPRVPNSSTRRRRQIKADVKKAIAELQLRVLKEGDKELDPNEESCVICFDIYKPKDVVRILNCKHFFHEACIDPWLLAHRTCPMCKCDILKA